MLESQLHYRRILAERGIDALASDLAGAIQSEIIGNRIGELALRKGMLRIDQLMAILTEQDSSGRPFGEVSMDLDILDSDQVRELLTVQAQERRDILREIVRALMRHCE